MADWQKSSAPGRRAGGRHNRRQSEWDDHGESYPRSHEGPDLYCNLSIPPGVFYLSLYGFNKDGHGGVNRSRDYVISVRESRSDNIRSFAGFERQPELARGRIRDFWGGCYKRFLVQGPLKITVRVARGSSYNTILSGLMLDPVGQFPDAYVSGRMPSPSAAATAADQLADALEELRKANPTSASVFVGYERTLLRWYCANPAPENPPAAVRMLDGLYRARYFAQWEALQQRFQITTAREIEKSLRCDSALTDSSGQESVVLARRLSAPAASLAPSALEADSRKKQ